MHACTLYLCSLYYADEDYIVVQTTLSVELTSDAPNYTITVTILDDDISEPEESFVIELTDSFPQASASEGSQRVTFNPRNITVVIMDSGMFNLSVATACTRNHYWLY